MPKKKADLPESDLVKAKVRHAGYNWQPISPGYLFSAILHLSQNILRLALPRRLCQARFCLVGTNSMEISIRAIGVTYDYHWRMHPLYVTGRDISNHRETGVLQVATSWLAGESASAVPFLAQS